jgi:glycosyltransferase involved in cell wall biosynthesis
VVGTGPEQAKLQRLAGPTVRLLDWQPDEVVRRLTAEARAVIIAGIEDFGMVTAEAQAAGRPPIAFAASGARDIVEDGVTGFLFHEPTPEAIGEAMQRAVERELDTGDLVRSAARFDVSAFAAGLRQALEQGLARRAPLEEPTVVATGMSV